MKLCVLNPVSPKEIRKADQEVVDNAFPELDIAVEAIEKGPASIESQVKEAAVVPEIVKLLKKVKDDYDGFLVNCFADPGVEAAREVTSKPVLGCGMTTMHLASILRKRFSILTIRQIVPHIEENVYKYGLSNHLSHIFSVDIPVLELENEPKIIIEKIKGEQKVLEEKFTDTIILGCTGMASVAPAIQKEVDPLILEPLRTTVSALGSILRLDLKY